MVSSSSDFNADSRSSLSGIVSDHSFESLSAIGRAAGNYSDSVVNDTRDINALEGRVALSSESLSGMGRFWSGGAEDHSDTSSVSGAAVDDRAAGAGAAADFVPPESELFGRVTPPPQPKGPLQPKVTPQSTRKAVNLVLQNLFTSPDKRKKAEIHTGFSDLQTVKEVEEEEGVEDDEKFSRKKARTIVNQIIHSISPQHDPSKAEFHAAASQKLDEEGGLSATTSRFVQGLVDIGGSPQRVIHTRHLSEYDPDKGGFHVDLDDHAHAVDVIAENHRTGVRYARIDGKKISTMFPDGVDLDHVVEITRSAEILAKRDNQSLRMTRDGYVIECYARGPVAFSSLFPVFLYEVFAPDQTFELIPGFSIDSQQALDAAKRQIAVVDCYSINDDQGKSMSLIVDIAPIFKDQTNIEKGMMFRFDRANAPELFTLKRKRSNKV